MTAVVRVKRPLGEEPLDALIINCKKRKTTGNTVEIEDSHLSALLKFAATVKNPDEDITEYVRKSSKNDAKERFKKHIPNLHEKLKQEAESSSKSSRYKFINCYRSSGANISTASDAFENENDAYTVFDIEYNKENIEPIKKSLGEAQYVYDLYYTNSDDFEDTNYNDISVYPLSDHLVYGTYRDNGIDGEESDCSEDSNAENNWRNEYPDESDMESINEDDMIEAVQRCNIDEDEDLSSDAGEEEFVYGFNSEGINCEEDTDENDENRFGKLYAKFKAKVKSMEKNKDIDQNFYYGDIDEEEQF